MGQNTAGGREKPPSLAEAVKTVRVQDFKQVHMYPCVRESLLTAFGGGFAVGGLRALLGGKLLGRFRDIKADGLKLRYRKHVIGRWDRFVLWV